MMKKIILICLANVMLHFANAQTFVNDSAVVVVTAGGIMSIRIDPTVIGSGSLENIAGSSGILRNKGLIQIEGSFVNTSGIADGFGCDSGTYRIQGDWENNATFKADSSTVVLYGSLPQQITGSSITTFYNLVDSNPGVKTQTIDANVAGNLTIWSVEHATANNLLTILNADPLAIAQNTVNDAFISSTGNGRLIRYTNQKAEYIFPTGITEAGAPKIREASVTPPNTTPRNYRVRYADDQGSATTTTDDGYNVTQKEGNIKSVNNVYYHIVTASTTDPADLAIFYDPAVDDTAWQGIARWQGSPTTQWYNLLNCSVVPSTNGSPRLKVVKSAWIPTSDSAHALIDTIAVSTDFNFPTAFVGDCQTCTGGTPSQGNNGVFGIINQANLVTLQELSVFNRWGEMVFDSKRDGTDNWNGHFNGKLAAQGNYVYRAVVINNSTGKQYPLVTGNVALLW